METTAVTQTGSTQLDGDQPQSRERIATLLAQMPSHRKILLGIIAACSEGPLSRDDAEKLVSRLKIGNASVYGAGSYCALLERAGAIELVDQNGGALPTEAEEPHSVTVDGVECLSPGCSDSFMWAATSAGKETLANDRPGSRLENLLSEKALYLPVFKRILTLCAPVEGASTSRINETVDPDPLLSEPRHYASYFTEHLESCEAICWVDGMWRITDLGLETLASLDDVDDEYGRNAIAGLYAINIGTLDDQE